MSEEFGIEIEGLEECCQSLQQAPRRAMLPALAKGLAAGGKVIEDAVSLRVPVAEGALKADLDTDVRIDADGRGGQALVGFSGKQAHKAGWVEYGHRQVGHKPQKKDEGTVQAHPFMRPAAEVAAEAAVDAFAETVMDELAAEQIVDAA